MTRWPGDRYISVTVIQVVGLGCLMVAAWKTNDGWYSLGIFGVALMTVAEVAHRNDR